MNKNWTVSETTIKSNHYTWQIERPAPKLPNSYFWTWDHSANWVLDDPGIQTQGCYNKYFKLPSTYVEDYRRLTDMCAGIGIPGIVIWGFLRDSHGGIEAARKVASYAKAKGVSIMPGFGVTWYGGPYYEGADSHNLGQFLLKHPEARMLAENGSAKEFAGEHGACVANADFQAWLREGVRWILDEFDIGGLNIENGDMLVDYHPLVKELRKSWPADDPESFFHQGVSYKLTLDACGKRLKDKLCAYATYTGFNYTEKLVQNTGMGKKPPAMLSVLPEGSVAQWTLTGMLLHKPLPLTAWLDDGKPAAAFDNPTWPRDLRPPCKRSVGFVHQGSQWSGNRYDCVVSQVKESCLRAYLSGLEGVSIHGEVSNYSIPSAMNYLAFSHFIHWPEDSLRDFGRKTMGPVLGSEADGVEFIEILANCDAGTVTEDQKNRSRPACHGFTSRTCASNAADAADYQRFRFWAWLAACAKTGTLVKGGVAI